MRKLIAIVVCCTLLLGCSHHKPKEDPYALAQADYQAGHYEQAVAGLMPLARQGNTDAQYTLGYMYYYGLGMKRDRTQGYFWLQSAAASGNPKANAALAMLTQDTRVRLNQP